MQLDWLGLQDERSHSSRADRAEAEERHRCSYYFSATPHASGKLLREGGGKSVF